MERGPRLLAREDEEVSRFVASALARDGVEVRVQHQVQQVQWQDGQKWAELVHGGQVLRQPFDELIIALGRRPRLEGYGLEALGLLNAQGELVTDSFCVANYPTSMPQVTWWGPINLPMWRPIRPGTPV